MKIYLDRVNDVTYKYAKCYYEISYILGYIKIKNMIKKFIAKGAACRRANLPSTYIKVKSFRALLAMPNQLSVL
jgi:hypothetical protein